MKNYVFNFVLILFLCSCSDNIIDSNYGSGEEYLIYQEIFQNRFGNSSYTIILNDSTQSERFDSSSIKNICKDIDGLQEETLLNYIEVNNKKIKLKKIVGANIIFRSEYDKSQTNVINVYISRVGFNASMTQAVVTMGEMSGIEAGGGTLFLLEKKDNDNWRIIKLIGTWVA